MLGIRAFKSRLHSPPSNAIKSLNPQAYTVFFPAKLKEKKKRLHCGSGLIFQAKKMLTKEIY